MNLLVCSTGFLPAAAMGGLPYSTFHLCQALMRAGARVRVITTDRDGAARLSVTTDQWTTYEGVPVWYGRTSPGPFLYARSASAAIRDQTAAVDCVINSATLWVHSGVMAWRASREFKKPAITYVRGLLDPWALQFKPWRKRALWHLWGKRILRDSAAIVALNDTERDHIRRLGVTTRIEVIPNGAAIAEDSAGLARDVVDTAFPALAGSRYLLFLGRVHPKKGLDILIPALADVLPSVDATMCVIAGPIDPDYRDRFAALLRQHRLDTRITLAGTVAGTIKAALLKHAAVFVLPSYSEGLPIAVLEALSAGCPAIVSHQCNLPEIATAGAGIVIDPDRRALADACRLLLSDESRRQAMGVRAAELARTRFDWDAIASRTLALCEEVVRGAARASVIGTTSG
jgi:poly(glycerol-phosphate) alpha-glucosyltransferase